jgi:hypothetical protein
VASIDLDEPKSYTEAINSILQMCGLSGTGTVFLAATLLPSLERAVQCIVVITTPTASNSSSVSDTFLS